MALLVSSGNNNYKEFELPSDDLHNGIICHIEDRGLQTITYNGKSSKKHIVRIWFMLEEKASAGFNHTVFKDFTLSFHEKSKLAKFVYSVVSQEWLDTQKSKYGSDTNGSPIINIEDMKGLNLRVLIKRYTTTQGKTYANITDYSKAKRDMSRDIPWQHFKPRTKGDVNEHNQANNNQAVPQNNTVAQSAQDFNEDADDCIPF